MATRRQLWTWGVLFLTGLLAYALSHTRSQALQKPLFQKVFLYACQTVKQKYFEDTPSLRQWYQECLQSAEKAGLERTASDLLAKIQMELNLMGVSHLEVWDPDASRRLWQSQGLDTGLRVRKIQDHLVITELVEGGPAAEAGLLLGDRLLKRDGQVLEDVWAVRTRSGVYEILRGEEERFEVTLVAREIRIDESPRLVPVTESVAWLRVSSFVADNFAEWETVATETTKFEGLVIDVRGNGGGDFTAMLRALSLFFCQPTSIGSLVQPRLTQGLESLWPDDLDPSIQLRFLKTAKKVQLSTFEGYPCFKGSATVLVDEQTGSTAEIFAEAFRLRPQSRIWGQFTSGQVVLSVWYSLPLGTGYSLNVPQADYVSAQGVRLEGHGVWPDKNLEYDLQLALQGRDSWIADAATNQKGISSSESNAGSPAKF